MYPTTCQSLHQPKRPSFGSLLFSISSSAPFLDCPPLSQGSEAEYACAQGQMAGYKIVLARNKSSGTGTYVFTQCSRPKMMGTEPIFICAVPRRDRGTARRIKKTARVKVGYAYFTRKKLSVPFNFLSEPFYFFFCRVNWPFK